VPVPSGATTGNVVVTVGGVATNGVAFTVATGPTVYYYLEDSLGTSRVMTTSIGVVCYDADFTPYGGERAATDSCAQNNYKFEGKERDTETGNDDFGARYYSNRFGRWLSADWSSVPVPVPYANLANPQTLNLYSMVADDPESFADLDGHGCPQVGGAFICGLQHVDDENSNSAAFLANAQNWNRGAQNNGATYKTQAQAAKAALKGINKKSIKENKDTLV
jgi:RHS repeat-associated protein